MNVVLWKLLVGQTNCWKALTCPSTSAMTRNSMVFRHLDHDPRGIQLQYTGTNLKDTSVYHWFHFFSQKKIIAEEYFGFLSRFFQIHDLCCRQDPIVLQAVYDPEARGSPRPVLDNFTQMFCSLVDLIRENVSCSIIPCTWFINSMFCEPTWINYL